MKRLFFLFPLCAVLHSALALPEFDPFTDATANGGTSYAVGADLDAQQLTASRPWASIGSTNGGLEPKIVAGSLSYPDFPAAVGNSVAFFPSVGGGARLTVSTTTVNTAYYSYLLKITDISTVGTNAANNYFTCFSDNTVAQPNGLQRGGARVGAKKVGSGYVLGISKSSVAAEYVYDTTVHNVDEVVLVVAKFERVGTTVTNVSLWVNPPSSSFGAASAPTPTVTTSLGNNNDLNTSAVRSFVINCQSASAPAGIIDEVRVATSWAYVTGGDPAVTENPANQTKPPGDTVTLSVTARGTPTLTYQWLKDNVTLLTDGGSVSGATTSTLTLTGISAGDAGSYAAIVMNGLGNSVTSSPAILTVADPAITTQPQGSTNDFGTTATLSVAAAGTGPFTYQWQKNGTDLPDGGNISGATTEALTLTGVSYADAGNYTVVVTNGLGSSTTSSAATLTVRDPVINAHPLSRTNVTGTPATFSVTASGSPTITYQWKRGTTTLVDGGTILGAQTSSLTITSVAPGDAGNYTVVASGSASGLSSTSSVAVLTVLDPLVITSQPMSRNVAIGANVGFGASVTGTTPGYQWRLNGADISGATADGYALTNVQTGGTFTVVISNMLNVVTSTPAVLTVSPQVNLYSTNLIVVRGGDGAQPLANSGNTIFLDQYTTAGAYVNSVSLPDSGGSAFIQNGISATEGFLNRSMDGKLLTLAGYNFPRPHTGNLGNATSATVPRGIATVNSAGQFNLAVSSTTAFDQNNIRSAVTDGTNNFWASGGGAGTRYFGTAGANILIQDGIANTRFLQIVNGELYFSSASVVFGIHKITGRPTALTTQTNLFLPTGNSQSSPSDFAISPNGTTAYTTEDGSASGNIYAPGIIKWTFDTGNWVSNYTLLSGTGTRGLTVDFSINPPMLYTTTTNGGNDANNRLLAVQDSGPGALPVTFATAGPRQAFRGIRFGPLASTAPTAPSISAARDGNNVVLQWNAPGFALESSTSVTGPYAPVSGATSPYTNSTASNGQLFFRLKN